MIEINNIEAAKEIIIKTLNECFLYTHKDYPLSKFYIQDKQALREKKLCRLAGKDDNNIKLGKNSNLLFEIDYKKNYFWYHYDLLIVMKIQYKLDKEECVNIIKSIIENKLLLNLKPSFNVTRFDNRMKKFKSDLNQG